ncbi:hypothetical protein OG21DRAFT_1504896 [Imleria badia]|nr:hypothetical protein OG21DRAFT_1504896 [Imleria badia]
MTTYTFFPGSPAHSQVSKQFHAIINDPTFWRTIHADAHLPRPPGPFSWQSTKFLQRTLGQSARLAQYWTPQSINAISRDSLQVPFGPNTSERVCGRWMIICTGMRHLVSYDLDTGSEQTLCHWDDKWVSWSATSCLMSTRGNLC